MMIMLVIFWLACISAAVWIIWAAEEGQDVG